MDKIFKYFVKEFPNTVRYINWFVKNFPEDEFSGIDKVLYFFLEYCSHLGIIAKKKYLLVFLDTELKKLVRQHNIRVDSLTANFNYDEIAAFEQAVQTISTATVDYYDKFCEVEALDDLSEFKVELSLFMNQNLQNKIMSTFTDQFSKMTQGGDIILVADETRTALSGAREVYNVEKLSTLDFAVREQQDTGDTIGKARLITKTGIPAIDEDYGGLFTKALITFAGQPGGGKTRFLLAVYVYPSLVYSKVGVFMNELELEDYEINNILISIHIANLYKLKIPDRDMNRGDLSDEQRKIVESARIDLFESGKYGKFKLDTKPLAVEGLYDSTMNILRTHPEIKVWCCDYLGLIRSNPSDKYSRKNRADIIDEALVNAKLIAKDGDVASVCVNQYNDEGNKAAYAGKPITVGMIQGGQSIQRHSDYDVAITFTEEQRVAQMRMISTTKVRSAVGFNNVPLGIDLACSRWTQLNKMEGRS